MTSFSPTTVITQGLWHGIGATILILNKLRKSLTGYTNPRGFKTSDINRAITYDTTVVASWRTYLSAYTNNKNPFANKHILELGPGADLGIGLLLLASTARSYQALDKHPLASSAPRAIYDRLIDSLHHLSVAEKTYLTTEIEHTLNGKPHHLTYHVDPSFTTATLKPPIDLIVSQAAFEHFDNPHEVIQSLNRVVHPGTILCAEIDLMTHTRYLRENDPLNIYRYSDSFYQATSFAGTPNRWRSADYIQTLIACGWGKIRCIPLQKASSEYLAKTKSHLARQFNTKTDDWSVLTCMILATKN